jgi:hypothetical protein
MNDPRTIRDQVPGGVSNAARLAGWPGTVLPALRVSGFPVLPVVIIDDAAWAHRHEHRARPELDMSTLAIWEGWMPELGPAPPRSVATIIGFVSTAPQPRQARYELESLSGYGAGMWVATGARRPASWTLAECDVAGITVIWDGPAGTHHLVAGRSGRAPTARRTVATRHKEELLFAHAVAAGYTHLRSDALSLRG